MLTPSGAKLAEPLPPARAALELLHSSPRMLDPAVRYVVGMAVFHCDDSDIVDTRNTSIDNADNTGVVLVPSQQQQQEQQQQRKKQHRLLLVKRAAHEVAFPNAWELPGGHVEDTDETVLHAVAREALEETGLAVGQVLGSLPEMRWQSERERSRPNVQLNYVVTVTSGSGGSTRCPEVKLNPDEHSAWLWAAPADMHGLEMTSEMRRVVQDAFDFAASHLSLT
jgi:8-oxo-dGTP pyrophosphatase MutT (NUDIX family)